MQFGVLSLNLALCQRRWRSLRSQRCSPRTAVAPTSTTSPACTPTSAVGDSTAMRGARRPIGPVSVTLAAAAPACPVVQPTDNTQPATRTAPFSQSASLDPAPIVTAVDAATFTPASTLAALDSAAQPMGHGPRRALGGVMLTKKPGRSGHTDQRTGLASATPLAAVPSRLAAALRRRVADGGLGGAGTAGRAVDAARSSDGRGRRERAAERPRAAPRGAATGAGGRRRETPDKGGPHRSGRAGGLGPLRRRVADPESG